MKLWSGAEPCLAQLLEEVDPRLQVLPLLLQLVRGGLGVLLRGGKETVRTRVRDRPRLSKFVQDSSFFKYAVGKQRSSYDCRLLVLRLEQVPGRKWRRDRAQPGLRGHGSRLKSLFSTLDPKRGKCAMSSVRVTSGPVCGATAVCTLPLQCEHVKCEYVNM